MNAQHPQNSNVTPEIIKAHVAQFYDNSQLSLGDTKGKQIGITGAELLAEPGDDCIPFLISSLMQQTGLACIAGSSDTGKSCLLRQLAIAVATGAPDFLGYPITSVHQRAIYVATEDGKDATKFMLRRQSKQYPQHLENITFLFDDDQLFENLEASLIRQPVDIVIIDCFQDAYGNDLKDSQKIRNFLHEYMLLAERHKCLFLFLHHTGKRTENYEPSKNNLLSGQGFEAKTRLVIELRADLSDPHKRHLCIVKANYLPAHMKTESHVLHFDETSFTFTNTGERVPHELLVKPEAADNSKAKFEEAKELRKQGLSHKQIAEKMGYSSKSSITALFAKARASGWEEADSKEE